MSIWIMLKIFGDICVLCGILGAFPGYFMYRGSLFFPAIVCAISVGAASALSRRGKDRLRWLSAVIAASALLLAGEGAELRILLPLVCYSAFVIFRGQFDLEYYSYRQYFLRSLILVGGLYLLLSVFAFLEGIDPGQEGTIYPNVTLRFSLVHLICGVVLQRQLRLGLTDSARGNRGQLVGVFASLTAVILAFLAAEPVLRKGAAAVVNGILAAVFSVVEALLDAFESMLDQIAIQAMQEQVQAYQETEEAPYMRPVVQQLQEAARNGPEEESYWWVWLVAAVAVGAMVLLLASYRKGSPSAVSTGTVTALEPEKFGRKDSRRSNRGKVRHCYREFLKMENRRGLKLSGHDTTEDILRRISRDTDRVGAAQLREIYLSARYNEKAEITPEQAEAAKAALCRSRGGQKQKA